MSYTTSTSRRTRHHAAPARALDNVPLSRLFAPPRIETAMFLGPALLGVLGLGYWAMRGKATPTIVKLGAPTALAASTYMAYWWVHSDS